MRDKATFRGVQQLHLLDKLKYQIRRLLIIVSHAGHADIALIR